MGRDQCDRALGVCSVVGPDINEAMFRTGFAWTFVKYSNSYVQVEAQAPNAGAGNWQGEAEPAWVFREKRRQTAEIAKPAGCAIKGNNGEFYHGTLKSRWRRDKLTHDVNPDPRSSLT